MKGQCAEAAALEAKDVELGRAAWIEMDRMAGAFMCQSKFTPPLESNPSLIRTPSRL